MRKKVQEFLKKFGIDYKDDKNKMFEIPDIKQNLKNFSKKAFDKNINSNENYIIVEDLQINSKFGLGLCKNNVFSLKQELNK